MVHWTAYVLALWFAADATWSKARADSHGYWIGLGLEALAAGACLYVAAIT